MMDLLKRFEEDGLDDDPFAHQEYSDGEGGGGDDDGDDDDLERRLAGLDLGEWRCSLARCPDTRALCRECFRGQNLGRPDS